MNRSSALCLLTVFIIVFTARTTAADSERVAPLRSDIADAIARHDYVQAARLNRRLTSELEHDSSTAPYQLVDSRWTQDAFDRYAALGRDDVAQLAYTDSLTDAYRELRARRKLGAARSVLEEMIPLRRELLGGEHPDIAAWQSELATIYNAFGDPATATALYVAALEVQERTLGHEHPDVATTLTGMAQALPNLGRFAEADSLARESLRIRLDIFGESSVEITQSLNALAIIAYRLEDYDASVTYDRRRLAILIEHNGSADLAVVGTMHDLAVTLVEQGDFEGGLELYAQVIESIEEAYGSEHFYVAFTAQNMAVPLSALGRYDEAEQMLRRAEPYFRDNMGETSEMRMKVVDNLATLLTQRGRYAEAEELFIETLSVRRETMDPGNEEIAKTIQNYALLLHATGRSDEALVDLETATEMLRVRLGESSVYYGEALRHTATVLIDLDRLAEANVKLVTACENFEVARRRVSTRSLERVAYTAHLSPYRLLAYTQIELQAGRDAWASVERERARAMLDLLETKALRQLTAEEARHERELDERLSSLEEAMVAIDPGQTARSDSLRRERAQTEAEWREYQRELQARYPLTEGLSFTLAEIQQAMPARSAIMGWLDLDGSHYAYLLKKDGSVLWARLPELDDTVWVNFAREVRQRHSDLDVLMRDAAAIYEARVAPVADALADVERIVVVPSGPMLAIPLAVLPTDNGLFGERFDVTYAPSASVFAWLRTRDRPGGNRELFAIGDPPFSATQADDMNANIASTASRAVRDDTALPRLKGTRKEVAEISAYFPASTTLLGTDATEANVRSFSASGDIEGFQYLHFATHAIPNVERGEKSALILSQIDLPDVVAALAAGEVVSDGRLTMDEIMRDWQLDAELVTLSACETALGQIARGEGYIGFAHAFFRAGSRTLLLSLWQVADRPTRLLMQRFYENHIGHGMSKSHSLAAAQRWLREYETSGGRRPYQHPANWAAFIVVGDPE